MSRPQVIRAQEKFGIRRLQAITAELLGRTIGADVRRQRHQERHHDQDRRSRDHIARTHDPPEKSKPLRRLSVTQFGRRRIHISHSESADR